MQHEDRSGPELEKLAGKQCENFRWKYRDPLHKTLVGVDALQSKVGAFISRGAFAALKRIVYSECAAEGVNTRIEHNLVRNHDDAAAI